MSIKPEKGYCNFEFHQEFQKTDTNPNGVQIMKTCLEYIGQNIYEFLNSQNFSANLQGPKENYKLQYGRCIGLLFGAAKQKRKLSDTAFWGCHTKEENYHIPLLLALNKQERPFCQTH